MSTLLLCLLAGLPVYGSNAWVRTQSFEPWVGAQAQASVNGVLRALNSPGAHPGVVIASPSTSEPNYLYHWTRDAALTMDALAQLADRDPSTRPQIDRALEHFFSLSRDQQRTSNLSGAGDGRGLGEPKFYINGRAIREDWGRPQNDGPALRALVGIRWAWSLLARPSQQGATQLGGQFGSEREEYVRRVLYDSRLPSHSVIKVDLEYVAQVWGEPCIDLWEESHGHHFYTLLVMRQALVEGAVLADVLGDEGAARWYRSNAHRIEQKLGLYLAGPTIETVQPHQSFHDSGLDISILLGVLHARGIKVHPWMSVEHPKLIETMALLEERFKTLYPINRLTVDNKGEAMGSAMGRYPEDQYDGVQTGSLGNPWVLATAAMAEWHFLRGQKEVGDTYLRRLKYHARPDGSLFEQMDRQQGFMRGARDLTWSFVAFLTALWAR